MINNDSGTLVSVILPVYNGKKYIAQTIEMILASYHTNIELICVDDGSNDGSASICMQFATKDKRVRFYQRKTNGGVAESRNTGLSLCKGDYICFADQDDLIEPDFYENLLRDIRKSKSEIAISNIGHYVNNHKNPTYTIKQNRKLEKAEKEKLLKWLLLDEAIADKPTDTVSKTVWNVMFSRRLIENNDIRFERVVANEDDWLFLIRCIQVADAVYLEKNTLYYWRIHNSQTTQNPRYIINYSDKRRHLRQIVDSICDNLDCTDEEKKEYNVRYCSRVFFIGFRNAANAVWTGKLKMTEGVEELELLYQSLEGYLSSVPEKTVLKNCKTEYGLVNEVMIALVLKKKFQSAIKMNKLVMSLKQKNKKKH